MPLSLACCRARAKYFTTCLALILLMPSTFVRGAPLQEGVILTGPAFTKVVPTSFYFEGQSAPTQLRNAAAVRFAPKRHVIVGMVDTSGYSSEIRAKYEGFIITDSRISLGDKELGVGAYGFGFSDDGKFNIFDVGGDRLLSVNTSSDANMRRPRPLVMIKAADGIRLYSGKSYVIIAAK
jgi:hypothetical protein